MPRKLVVSVNSLDTWQALTLFVRAILAGLKARGILSAFQHSVRLCPMTVHSSSNHSLSFTLPLPLTPLDLTL